MTDREKLLAEAVAVGLILGADFEKNISNVNLQKKIEEKKAENTDNVKPPVDENNPDKVDTNALNDGVDNTDKNPDENNDLGDKENNLQKKIEESQEEVEEEKVVILRTSKCGAYKLKFVNGYEHCAAKNQILVEQLKEAIEAGKELNGFTYKLK